MKDILFDQTFTKKLKQIKKKDPILLSKIKRKIELFKVNPQHPSLRLHKLKGNLTNVWSVSITMDIRIVFIDDSTYYFFDIGTHDQVYKR